MQKIVVFTGAGISAESGLKTFRDSDGLWENHAIEDVATIDAWHRNPKLVQEFYNQRRKAVNAASPNLAHVALKKLEQKFEVQIITQNIDNLHERAGSSSVLHLHGEVTKSQSSANPMLVYTIKGNNLEMGQLCSLGSQLRPNVVWFGEAVPNMEKAFRIAAKADIFITIGTSLNVYPAASIVQYIATNTKHYFVDPNANNLTSSIYCEKIAEKASTAIPLLVEKLLNNNSV
jgi:NAD-dependent deacetylase